MHIGQHAPLGRRNPYRKLCSTSNDLPPTWIRPGQEASRAYVAKRTGEEPLV